jgi:aspartyl-tRNA(Asn)/glutamyl-tRNA(Gln) amidotransferase subunit A
MKKDDVCYLTIAELEPLLREKKLSPVELTKAFLERIEGLDGRLHSFITVMAESALADAKTAEAAIASGKYKGALHGIPIGLKDLYQTRGVKTTAGSRILANFVPPEDATTVTLLRAAGCIILGKLNLHEFAYGSTGVNPHYDTPRNPWDLECLPGGSSSGSGVAVMAGLVTAATGSDTGGSIRMPSAICGIAGIKPTYGRVSKYGLIPLSWSLDHAGPMARSVEDCAILLQAMAGHDPRDNSSSVTPVPNYRLGLQAGVQGLRVGLPRELFFDSVQEEVKRSVEQAIEVMKGLGMSIHELSWPEAHDAVAITTGILGVEAATYHRRWLRECPQEYDPATLSRLQAQSVIPAVDYLLAQQARTKFVQRFSQIMEKVDVLVTPTEPVVVPRIGETTMAINGKEYPTQSLLTNFTRVFNVAGTPAMSIPCGFSTRGTPIGMQVIGKHFDEATVLRVAYSYEQATKWHTLRPSL